MTNQDHIYGQVLPRNKIEKTLLRGTRLIFALSGLCVLYWALPYIVSLTSGLITKQISAGAKTGLTLLLFSITAQAFAITGLTFIGLKIARDKWNDLGFAPGLAAQKHILGGIAAGAIYGILIKLVDYHPAVWAEGLHGILLAARILIISPFLEELFCRGLIFRLLEHEVSPRINIFLTALFYALTHYHFVDFMGRIGVSGSIANPISWWPISVYFVLGIICAFIRHRSKSIWPAISVHITYNSVLFFL